MNEPEAPARLWQEIAIFFEGRAPSLNARPGNWQAARRVHDSFRDDAVNVAIAYRNRWEAMHGLRWRPLRKCRVMAAFVGRDHRRRDWDNLAASLKPLLDAIVTAKLIADDSTDVIELFELAYTVEKGKTGTWLSIREVDE